MPTYNRAQFIAETLESICGQTFSNWELLVMDDGSDDDTAQIIEQINDERIRYYKMERTGQVSKLKNMAIKKARGELIAFMDSDDLWELTKLEKQLAAMVQFPQAGFCLTGGFTFIHKDQPVQYLYKQRAGVWFDDLLLPMFRSEISGFTQALLFKKACVQVSGYFDETKSFADPDLILSLARHYKGVVLYEPLFFRRLHELSDSNAHWEKRYNEWVNVIEHYHSKKYIPVSEARQALFKLYINFGEKCLLKKQRVKAISNFLKAWINKPLSIVPLKKTGKVLLNLYR